MKELEQNLRDVEDTYAEDDSYALYNERCYPLDICLLNEGEAYVDDASVRIEMMPTDGLFVFQEEIQEPDHRPFYPKLPVLLSCYPSVTVAQDMISASAHVGDLRHKIPAMAFETPLRMLFGPQLIGQEVNIKFFLFGRNIPRPIESVLVIKVVEPI